MLPFAARRVFSLNSAPFSMEGMDSSYGVAGYHAIDLCLVCLLLGSDACCSWDVSSVKNDAVLLAARTELAADDAL